MKFTAAKCLTVIVLIFILSSGFGSVLAQGQYVIGVKLGDYVKYGNFVVSGPRAAEAAAFNIDWQKIEVVNVTADQIRVLQTGVFKNGTVVPYNGTTVGFSLTPSQSGIFLPANISQGEDTAAKFNVTKTENRTYLGVSRTVNIAEFTDISGDSTFKVTFVYDKISGIALQGQLEEKESNGTTTASYSLIETNIFSLPSTSTRTPAPSSSSNVEPSPSIPEFPPAIVVSLIAVSTLIGASVWRRKNNKRE